MADSSSNISDRYVDVLTRIVHNMEIGITVSKSRQYPGDMYLVEYPNGETDQFHRNDLINFVDSLRAAYDVGFETGKNM